MTFLGLAILTVMSALMAVYFKSVKSEYGLYISLIVCVVAMFFGISKLTYFMEVIELLRGYIGLDNAYVVIILKIIGISYVAEFASDVCKDCGYSAMSSQIQMVGKLTIFGISIPIIMTLLETIGKCFEMGAV